MVEIPAALRAEIDEFVSEGRFPDRDTAIVELVRIGLDEMRRRQRTRPRPGEPPERPPPPPGINEPHDDRPIDVKPWDVNWMG